MPKMNFHMGVTLRCYGNVEVEAETVEAAFPLLTADFLAEHIDIKEVTQDSGQNLAIIDVSDAETGEELADYGGHFLPSPYDPQPDAKLLAALKAIRYEATTDIAGISRDEALEIVSTIADIARTAVAKATAQGEPETPPLQCDDWPNCACGRGGPDCCTISSAASLRHFEVIHLRPQGDGFDWAVTKIGDGLAGIICGLDGKPARYASETEAKAAAEERDSTIESHLAMKFAGLL